MNPTQFDIFARALPFVSVRCKIPMSVIDSPSRTAPIVFARSVLIHILRTQAGMTLIEIGTLLNRHHTAILAALRSLDVAVQTNCAMGRQAAALIAEFSSNTEVSEPARKPRT